MWQLERKDIHSIPSKSLQNLQAVLSRSPGVSFAELFPRLQGSRGWMTGTILIDCSFRIWVCATDFYWMC
jgi:hypothetical protein